MLQLKDDNGNDLPKEVQDRVNNFIDNLQNVSWFKPKPDLKKSDVEKQINFMLECFGVEADIEFKTLKTDDDWRSARRSILHFSWYAPWGYALRSAMDSAGDSARDSIIASDWRSARDSAWRSAFDATCACANYNPAWHSAYASQEILLEDNEEFKKKYPNGAFKQLFKLWEMGLCPAKILEDTGKFTVYVPDIDLDTWGDTKLPPQEEVTLSDGKTYIAEERGGEKILKLKQ